MRMNYALIFAGGVGSRMRSKGTPKQFLKVFDKPIIVHTIQHFQNSKYIHKIIVVCIKSHIEYMKRLAKQYNLDKIVSIVPGGRNGQESIWNGLKTIKSSENDSDIILIHDGVRPLIDEDLIYRNIESVKKYGSAISCSAAIETFCLFNKESTLTNILDRSQCALAKAPQSFWLKDIIKAHLLAQKDNFTESTDSASLITKYGPNRELHFVPCENTNIKVTIPYDYYIFKAILEAKEIIQIIGL